MKAIIFLFLLTLIVSCNYSKSKKAISSSEKEEKSYLIDSLPTYVYHDSVKFNEIYYGLEQLFKSDLCDSSIVFNFQFEKNKSFPLYYTKYCDQHNCFPTGLTIRLNKNKISIGRKSFDFNSENIDSLAYDSYTFYYKDKKSIKKTPRFILRVSTPFSFEHDSKSYFNKIFEIYNSEIWNNKLILILEPELNFDPELLLEAP